MRKRAYLDIQVLRDVYVSSSGHYTGAVRFVRNGQRFKYDVDLSGGISVFGRGLNEIKLPQYVMNKIRDLYLEAFERGHNQYHEYDRDGNKRYEDLRYHSQEAVNWIIECLRNLAHPATRRRGCAGAVSTSIERLKGVCEMTQLIDKSDMEKIESLLKKWNDACRAALEHGTPENNRAADVLAGTLAGYVRPLFDTLQEISIKSDAGRLFEGCDELNDETHEANEKSLIGSMDTINAIARGVYEE